MTDNPNSLRQILYNKDFHEGDQESLPIEWTFVIINQPQEIERIEDRLYEVLMKSGPCGEGIAAQGITKYDHDSAVPEDNLHARYLNFRSQAERIRSSKRIYRSDKWNKDRDLRIFTEEQFGRYIESFQKRKGIYVPNP